MSLIDEVRSVEERVIVRLRELAPAVAEYGQLLELAQRLGVADQVEPPVAPGRHALVDASASVSPEPSAAKPKGRGSRRGASAASERRDGRVATRIGKIVAAEPGITVAGLAERLGVPANTLYRPVRRLTDEGSLSKRGRGLHPA